MGRHDSRRPSINTSTESVLRRLEYEFVSEPTGLRDLLRAHLRSVAFLAIGTGALLTAVALLAPAIVVLFGVLLAAVGSAAALFAEDDDRMTGVGRMQRWCRTRMRRARRLLGALRPHRRRRPKPAMPLVCRLAPWLFPDPGGRRR